MPPRRTHEEILAAHQARMIPGGGRANAAPVILPTFDVRVERRMQVGRAGALVIAHKESHPRSIAGADLVVGDDGNAAEQINAAMFTTWDACSGYPPVIFLDGYYTLEAALTPPYGMDMLGDHANLQALDPGTFTDAALIVLDNATADRGAGSQRIIGLHLGNEQPTSDGGAFDLIRIIGGTQDVWLREVVGAGFDHRFLYLEDWLTVRLFGCHTEYGARNLGASEWLIESTGSGGRLWIHGSEVDAYAADRAMKLVRDDSSSMSEVHVSDSLFWGQVDIRNVFESSFHDNHVNSTLTVAGWQSSTCHFNVLQGVPPITYAASSFGTGFDGDCRVFGNEAAGTGTIPDSLPLEQVATASGPVGSVVRKLEVFDRNGTSLGFVPIYSSIT